MWRGNGVQYVSGHAATNICRKVSAAVIDFAISHALIDNNFFVGAGFASLPVDPDAKSRLQNDIKTVAKPDSMKRILDEIEFTEDVHAAYSLADILDDPTSYKPQPFGATHFQEVLESREIDHYAGEIAGWITHPQNALELMGANTGFGEIIGDIKVMPEKGRAGLAYSLRKYAALLDSEDLLAREVADVQRRSGLVRQRQSSLQMDVLASPVRD